MEDWSDLRYLLAVARRGSTTAAAKALGVNQSTVHRRLAELERQLGRRLVERYPTGYRLTALGEELRPLAERVEAGVHDFERLAASSEIDLVGTVRVTCPETVGYRMMKTPLLDSFHSRYPRLRIELMMVDRVLDLAKGEADVAFRTAPPQDDALVSRKLADVPWGVFASRSYIEKHGQPEQAADINKHQIIGFGGIIAGHPAAGWLRSIAADARVAAVCTTTPALVLAVKSGAGLAPLPIAAVKNEPDLVPLLGSAPVLTAFSSGFSSRHAADASRSGVLRFRHRGDQGISRIAGRPRGPTRLKRDDIWLNRHRALESTIAHMFGVRKCYLCLQNET